MAIKFTELSGWSFDADEVSAGVFRVVGSDRFGRKIEKTGTDPDALIEACRQDAIRMMKDYDARKEEAKLD
jgi:hypothetical protein